MSNAPRDATWNSRSRSCDGHDRWLGQRMSTSPSLAGASGVPHDGHSRRHDERALGAVAQVHHRPDDLGDHVARLAQHHGVADEHALARRPRSRCAASPSRPSTPTRTPAPSPRTASRARCARRSRGCRGAWCSPPRAGTCTRSPTAAPGWSTPSRRCSAISSTFITMPSISCSTSCRCSP